MPENLANCDRLSDGNVMVTGTEITDRPLQVLSGNSARISAKDLVFA